MSRALALMVALASWLSGCSGPQRPSGPPPEYERPQIEPWDTGAPVDPLENVEGEWVTDEPEPASVADAGAETAADATAPDSDASAPP